MKLPGLQTLWVAPMEQAEHHGHEEERCQCGDHQATDHRAAQGGVLLTSFTQSQRHREHADDHGQRRHEHRAQAADAGFPGRSQRVAALLEIAAKKLTTRTEFAVATPKLMIAPIKAGTLKVVTVR